MIDPQPLGHPPTKPEATAEASSPEKSKRRPTFLLVLFAFVLFFVGRAVANELAESRAAKTTVQFNGKAVQIDAYSPADRASGDSARPTPADSGVAGRPMTAALTVTPGNFDADGAQDGWHARVVLLDHRHRIVNLPFHARFDLISQAEPSNAGRHGGPDDHADTPIVLQTWHHDSDVASPIGFTEQGGVVRCRLILSAVMQSDRGDYSRGDFGLADEFALATPRPISAGDREERFAIRVHLAVAGHGSFDAVTGISAPDASLASR